MEGGKELIQVTSEQGVLTGYPHRKSGELERNPEVLLG